MTLTELKSKYEVNGRKLGAFLVSGVDIEQIPKIYESEVSCSFDEWVNNILDCIKVSTTEKHYTMYLNEVNSSFFDGYESILIVNFKVEIPKAEYQKITKRQNEYIDQQAEVFFQHLKLRYDKEPKQCHEEILCTVLWILTNKMPEPINKILWLPYQEFSTANQSAYDKTFGVGTPTLDTIREAYCFKDRLGVSWVKAEDLSRYMINPQIAMFGYENFFKYLDRPAVEVKGQVKKHAKTVKKEQDYYRYTQYYLDLRKSVNPPYNRESAIKKTLKEMSISEDTLGRALNENHQILVKFGHKKNYFTKYSRIKY